MSHPSSAAPDPPALARALARVRRGLARPLPGFEAQATLAPRPNTGSLERRDRGEGRPAAALILLYPRHEAPYLPLTVRAQDLPNHRGQVSLPGGVVDAGESLEEAALREADEEIGVPPEAVSVLGILSPVFIPPTAFLLHPVVGFMRERPDFRPNPGEVARILEIPLATLEDAATLRRETRRLREQDYEVPFFDLDGEKVWGATAMVLAEFLEVLGA